MNKLINSLIVTLLFVLIYIIINQIIRNINKHKLIKKGDKRKQTLLLLINSIVKYVLMIICVLTILNIYGVDTTALITSLGLLGLGVSLALQDTLRDFLAGFFIIFDNQYDIGDTISINNFRGEVIALGLKTTKIRAYTGEVNIIANRNIQEVINYSASNSLAIVDFEVSYDDDLNKVEKILTSLCEDLTNRLDNIKGNVELLGIEDLGSNGIKYRITVETKSMGQYGVQREIRKAVREELNKNGIVIPYSQVVIHNE